MRTLRDYLYSDKPLAPIREIGTNAYDAHVAAGIPDVPFKVLLPTSFEPRLSIRDYGLGLSPEFMATRFTSFGFSDKRGSDAAIGTFGYGCKSPYAYTDTFTVISRHKGIKSTYTCTLDERDTGVLRCVHTEPCGDETGLEVVIPVQPKDVYTFQDKARNLYRFFDPVPEIIPKREDLAPEWIVKTESGGVLSENYWGNLHVLMGGVPYKIDSSKIQPKMQGDIYLFMNIGDVDITPNREGVALTDRTVEAIKAKQEAFWDELRQKLTEDLEAVKNPWELRQRVRQFGGWEQRVKRDHEELRRKLPSVGQPKGLNAIRVATLALNRDGRWASKKGWGGSIMAFKGLMLNPKRTRINSRELPGDSDEYLLVTPHPNMTMPQFGQALRAWLAASGLKGIPVRMVDKYALKPKAERVRSRSSAPRGTFFKLVDESRLDGRHKSKAWEAVDTIPDDGVWVRINRFISEEPLAALNVLAKGTEVYGVKLAYTGEIPGQQLALAARAKADAWIKANPEACQQQVDHDQWGNWGSKERMKPFAEVLGEDHPLVLIGRGIPRHGEAKLYMCWASPGTTLPKPTFTHDEFTERYPVLGYPRSNWFRSLQSLKQWPAIIKFLDEEQAKEQDNEQAD